MPESRVSVIVVSYNTREKLRHCLECIERRHEIVVVDNASQDGSVEMVREAFPHVRLISNEGNVGFGVANNQGCGSATRDFVLFLNSDAYAEPGAIDLLASEMGAGIVAAGGRLLNPDGSLQQSTANELTLWAVFCEQTQIEKFGRGTIFDPYWTTFRNKDRTEPWKTPQVMGACLMVRATAGKPIEEFDPRYFLYCEDTDLCKRLRRHGEILHVPAACFVHELGSSSKRDPSMGIIRYNRGKELYFRIHHGPMAEVTCLILDRIGAAMRLTAWAALWTLRGFRSERHREQVRAFWRVLTASRRSAEGSPRTPEQSRPEGRFA